jgi:hypothetical protein
MKEKRGGIVVETGIPYIVVHIKLYSVFLYIIFGAVSSYRIWYYLREYCCSVLL